LPGFSAGPPERAQGTALVATERQFATDVEEHREDNPFDQRLGVIEFVRQPGITFCLGRGEILDLERRLAIGKDRAGPDDEWRDCPWSMTLS
jgi:hypothetical protein